jgi:hypothetical protein
MKHSLLDTCEFVHNFFLRPILFLFGAVCWYLAEREGAFDLKRSLPMIYREEGTF